MSQRAESIKNLATVAPTLSADLLEKTTDVYHAVDALMKAMGQESVKALLVDAQGCERLANKGDADNVVNGVTEDGTCSHSEKADTLQESVNKDVKPMMEALKVSAEDTLSARKLLTTVVTSLTASVPDFISLGTALSNAHGTKHNEYCTKRVAIAMHQKVHATEGGKATLQARVEELEAEVQTATAQRLADIDDSEREVAQLQLQLDAVKTNIAGLRRPLRDVENVRA